MSAGVERFAHTAPFHTDEGDVTGVTGLGHGPECFRQEFSEGGLRQHPGVHCELAVATKALLCDLSRCFEPALIR